MIYIFDHPIVLILIYLLILLIGYGSHYLAKRVKKPRFKLIARFFSFLLIAFCGLLIVVVCVSDTFRILQEMNFDKCRYVVTGSGGGLTTGEYQVELRHDYLFVSLSETVYRMKIDVPVMRKEQDILEIFSNKVQSNRLIERFDGSLCSIPKLQ